MVGKGAALATVLLSSALISSPAMSRVAGAEGAPNGKPDVTPRAPASMASVPTAISPSPQTVPPGPVADPKEPARVYVYIGRTFWPGHIQSGVGGAPWDVAIDRGQPMALTPSRFLEFDTPAGTHRFTRYLHGVSSGFPASIDLTLAPGEEVYLGLNRYQKISPPAQSAEITATILGGVVFPYLVGTLAAKSAARRTGTGPETLDHPQGFWLVREPPPAGEPARSTPH